MRSLSRSQSPERMRSRSRSPPPPPRRRSRLRSPQPRRQRPPRRRRRNPPPRTFGHVTLGRMAQSEINNIKNDVQCMNEIAAKCAELDLMFASGHNVTFTDLTTQFPGESFPILYTFIYCTQLRGRLEYNLSMKY